MTPAQQQALQAGRAAAREPKIKQARERVTAFRAWIRAGCPSGNAPAIPTSGEFRAASTR